MDDPTAPGAAEITANEGYVVTEEQKEIDDETVSEATQVEAEPEVVERTKAVSPPENPVKQQPGVTTRIVKPRLLAGRDKTKWPRVTMEDIVRLCEKILAERPGYWMGERDAAMIACLLIFGKRASETTSLRKEDIEVKGERLQVIFTIKKKNKLPSKFCAGCGAKNGGRSLGCRMCMRSLADARLEQQVFEEGPPRRPKVVGTEHPLAKYFIGAGGRRFQQVLLCFRPLKILDQQHSNTDDQSGRGL